MRGEDFPALYETQARKRRSEVKRLGAGIIFTSLYLVPIGSLVLRVFGL